MKQDRKAAKKISKARADLREMRRGSKPPGLDDAPSITARPHNDERNLFRSSGGYAEAQYQGYTHGGYEPDNTDGFSGSLGSGWHVVDVDRPAEIDEFEEQRELEEEAATLGRICKSPL